MPLDDPSNPYGTLADNVLRGEIYVMRAAHEDGHRHGRDGLKRSAVGVPPFCKAVWFRGWDEGRIEWNWARVHARTIAQVRGA